MPIGHLPETLTEVGKEIEKLRATIPEVVFEDPIKTDLRIQFHTLMKLYTNTMQQIDAGIWKLQISPIKRLTGFRTVFKFVSQKIEQLLGYHAGSEMSDAIYFLLNRAVKILKKSTDETMTNLSGGRRSRRSRSQRVRRRRSNKSRRN